MNEIFSCEEKGVDKRKFLRSLIEGGQAARIPSRTPYSIQMLEEASEEVIEKLYARVQQSQQQKDVMSRIAGVDNLSKLKEDINSNFLIRKSTAKFIPYANSYTPAEITGSLVYEKFGAYLAPISLFATVFNHLDWPTFAQIAEERRAAEAESVQKSEVEGIFENKDE